MCSRYFRKKEDLSPNELSQYAMSDEIQLSFKMRSNTAAEETEKAVTHLTDIRRNKGRTAKSDSLPL